VIELLWLLVPAALAAGLCLGRQPARRALPERNPAPDLTAEDVEELFAEYLEILEELDSVTWSCPVCRCAQFRATAIEHSMPFNRDDLIVPYVPVVCSSCAAITPFAFIIIRDVVERARALGRVRARKV
jgi:hypothetical protein